MSYTKEQLEWLSKLDGEELCNICSYSVEGCTGVVRGGPNGPIYPPCYDQHNEELVEYDAAIEAFHQSFCDKCEARICTGCEHQH